MGHYDSKTKDCTDKDYDHTWSDLKTRNVSFDIVYRDGVPCLKATWQQYRSCETKMEYHGGRNVGIIEGRVCESEKDVERMVRYVQLETVFARPDN